MMLLLLIYLTDIVEVLNKVTEMLTFVLGILYMAYAGSYVFASLEDIDNPLSTYSNNFKKVLLVAITCLIINVITPSKQTLYMMLGAYIGQETLTKINESPITDKVFKALDVKLDEIIKQTK